MATSTKKRKLPDILDRLEAAYGALVPSDDAVEAGVLTLLAQHAPHRSNVQTRQALREWFVSWNELRVADPWDITNAIGASGDDAARRFAKAALKFLRSLHSVLNRCSFDLVEADPEADAGALVAKMRGAPPPVRAVMLAVLARDGEWAPDKETAKLAQKMELAPKTTSLVKVGRALAEQAGEEDRLRGHYLLTRYAHRGDDDDDPLDPRPKKRPPAKKAPANAAPAEAAPAAKTAPAKSASVAKAPAAKKPAAKKPAAKKPAAKAPAAKKPAAKKPAAKAPAAKKPAAKKPAAKALAAKKPAAKKPAAKKPAAKKPAAKKPAAKKPAAKKPAAKKPAASKKTTGAKKPSASKRRSSR